MIKEISKTVVEKVRVCDIDTCQHTAEYTCVVCNKDICKVHLYCVKIGEVLKYFCTLCSSKPFSEVYSKIDNNIYFVPALVIRPNTWPSTGDYPLYHIQPYGTGDYWYHWPITIVYSSFFSNSSS